MVEGGEEFSDMKFHLEGVDIRARHCSLNVQSNDSGIDSIDCKSIRK